MDYQKQLITVNVSCINKRVDFCTEVIQVKVSDTIETLRHLVTDRLEQSGAGSKLRCRMGRCLSYGTVSLKEEETFESYRIKNGTKLECILVKR